MIMPSSQKGRMAKNHVEIRLRHPTDGIGSSTHVKHPRSPIMSRCWHALPRDQLRHYSSKYAIATNRPVPATAIMQKPNNACCHILRLAHAASSW